jgi:hypothetical protein
MAVRKVVNIANGSNWDVYEWTGLLAGDTGDPITKPVYADRSVTIQGVDGATGSCAIEGSNTLNGTDWCRLRSPDHITIGGQTGEAYQVLENTLRIRPSVTGDGSTDYSVRMLIRATS